MFESGSVPVDLSYAKLMPAFQRCLIIPQKSIIKSIDIISAQYFFSYSLRVDCILYLKANFTIDPCEVTTIFTSGTIN